MKHVPRAIPALMLCMVLTFSLAACGGGGGGGGKQKADSYTIGGTVSGLEGDGLVLQCNGADDLAVTADGSFTFATSMDDGLDYAVTVLSQPSSPNQTCTVNNGTGTVSGGNVTDVSVVCSTEAYTIGGTVSGLSGDGLVLRNNGGDDLAITSGAFTFAASVADGEGYNVTVKTQPSSPNQTCTVNNGTGTVAGGNVTDVLVVCSTNSYTIGGTASGIAGSVVLQNNGGDDLTLTADETFTFATPVADTAGYAVTILSSIGQACTLSSAGGTVNGGDVTGVELACTPVSVSALYIINGTDWNDYVVNDGLDEFTATDLACDPAVDTACLHGGEMRVVEVPGKTSCARLTATEALGAFDWTCDASTGTARFISTGLKDDKNLSDLLDFAAPGWKDNSVTVLDGGVVYFNTSPAAWWANPVAVDNDGGYLNNAGTIYVVTASSNLPEGYIINASSVGLVGRPGVIINGPGAAVNSYVISADGSVNARDFLWFEGAVDATGDDRGVYLRSVRFSALRNVRADNANVGTSRTGVFLLSSSNNALSGVTASNNSWYGVWLDDFSSSNTLSGVMASNNGNFGVYLSYSPNNTLSGVTASNNTSGGVYLYYSSNNTLSGVTASNNGGVGIGLGTSGNNTLAEVTASNNNDGVYLFDSSNSTLSGVTASNNTNNGVSLVSSSNSTLTAVTASNNGSYGVDLDNSSSSTLSGVAAPNNGFYGFYIGGFWDNTLSGLAASNNGSYDVYLASSNNYFTGPLKVGSNSLSGNCYVSEWFDNPGLVNGTCTTDGGYGSGGPGGYGFGNISDATLYNGITLAGSFLGKVDTDDTANSSDGLDGDAPGTATYPTEPDTFDWTSFETPYRGWGREGTFGSVLSQGQCISVICRIWDWSLKLGDTGDAGNPAILGVLSLPTGDDTLTHTWSDTTTTTLLRNAVEVQGDGLGNENTLCESGETCLYMPNIGSYQGHGSLVDAGTFSDGDPITGITGVTLMKYGTNGY